MGSLVKRCTGGRGFSCAEHEGARILASRFPVDDDLVAVNAGFGDGHPLPVHVDEHPGGQLCGGNRVGWAVEEVDVAGRVVGFFGYLGWGRSGCLGVVGQVGSQDAFPFGAGFLAR